MSRAPFTVVPVPICTQGMGGGDVKAGGVGGGSGKQGVVLWISSFMSNYVYFHFELFLVMTHFVGDSWPSH